MAAFAPASELLTVHGWPRYDISQPGKGQVSNTFNADFASPDGQAYVMSVLTVGLILCILGALFTLLFLVLAYLALCFEKRGIPICCRSCCQLPFVRRLAEKFPRMCGCCVADSAASATGQRRGNSGANITVHAQAAHRRWMAALAEWVPLLALAYIVVIVVIISLALAVTPQLPRVRSAMADAAVAVRALAQLFSQADAFLRTVVDITSAATPGLLIDALRKAVELRQCAYLQTGGTMPSVQALETMLAIPDTLQMFTVAVVAMQQFAAIVASALSSTLLSGGALDLTGVGVLVHNVGAILVTMLTAWAAILACTLHRSLCCNRCFRVCNVCLMIVISGAFVVAGVLGVVSAVGADACYSPGATLASIVAATRPPLLINQTFTFGLQQVMVSIAPQGAATAAYYATCTPATAISSAVGAVALMQNGRVLYNQAVGNVSLLLPASLVPTDQYGWVYTTPLPVPCNLFNPADGTAFSPRINTLLDASALPLSNAAARHSCEPVSAAITALLQPLCNGAVSALISIFQLTMAIACCLVVLAFIAWRLFVLLPSEVILQPAGEGRKGDDDRATDTATAPVLRRPSMRRASMRIVDGSDDDAGTAASTGLNIPTATTPRAQLMLNGATAPVSRTVTTARSPNASLRPFMPALEMPAARRMQRRGSTMIALVKSAE